MILNLVVEMPDDTPLDSQSLMLREAAKKATFGLFLRETTMQVDEQEEFVMNNPLVRASLNRSE